MEERVVLVLAEHLAFVCSLYGFYVDVRCVYIRFRVLFGPHLVLDQAEQLCSYIGLAILSQKLSLQ